ncbi:methionine aminopeptidase 1D, mitochondrial isoform X2 [Lycorma delicatula]|uniref:methionine aminopeptidase 1D, mitochondrial isoform X2 n=1 Tax=Lycorma delicatula TaxID=130591 RepID=UPI003F51798C
MTKTFRSYSIVKPGYVKEMRTVPEHINSPVYYKTGKPPKSSKEIEIKTKEQIEKMRAAGQLARFILDEVGIKIRVGMTTDKIDEIVHNMAIEHGAYPSPLNYEGFPKSVCTSVNNVACHGIPDDRPLQDGDIINVDVTVYLNGYHGDCSSTFLIGDVDIEGIKLVNATYEALEAAMSICRPGEYFYSIGDVVEEVAKLRNYTVVPAYTGHGIGSYFHGPPDIIHCYNEYPGQMKPGMTFTIEPILSQGTGETVVLEDGWTGVTTDNSRTAQWEQTVLITESGFEVLTQ